MSMQIFPLSEIKERAKIAPDRVKTINLYSGHVTEQTPAKRPTLIYSLSRNTTGQWDENQLAYVANFRGQYTVQLKPTNEVFYVESNESMQGFNPSLFDANKPADVVHLCQQITRLEALVKSLTEERDELAERVEFFEDNGNKFAYSLEQLASKFFPTLTQYMSTPQQQQRRRQPAAMQGQQSFDWQNYKRDEELSLEDAFMVLAGALGEEKIKQIAERLQDEPHLINTINSFL